MKLVVSLSGGGDTRGWLWWFGGFLKSHHLDLVVYYLSCPGSIFLGIYPFLPGCPFYWSIIVHSNLL